MERISDAPNVKKQSRREVEWRKIRGGLGGQIHEGEGELETKAEQAARAELGFRQRAMALPEGRTRRAPLHLGSRQRTMEVPEGRTRPVPLHLESRQRTMEVPEGLTRQAPSHLESHQRTMVVTEGQTKEP
ncbi:hypothetical protein PO909_011241 [Leuciscus waleckii]